LRTKTGARLGAGTLLALAAASSATAGPEQKPSTQIRAFSPEADTYVSAAQPQRNFGRLHALRADGSPLTTAYLRFRVKKLRGEIAGVTLLLHAQAGASTSYQVRRVRENEWREIRLTYENAPRLSLRYASSKPVRRGAWSAVDVTPMVARDDDLVSLAVTTKSARGFVFESRESKHGPRLVVRTDTNGDKDQSEPITPEQSEPTTPTP
jgi:hypothetical protein